MRQADYKYTYSDRSNITLKSEQADLLIQSVERFKAAGLDLNLQEIFIWYFEQKGVENVERFIGVNNGGNNGMNLQDPALPVPLLQAMAQKLQKDNTENEQKANELENVIEERKL